MFKKGRGKEKIFFKKRRFDYARKNFENPFFKKQKKISLSVGWKLKISLVLFLSAIGGLIWFFLFSSFWQIDTIEVSGLVRMNRSEIDSLVQEKINGKLLFVIPRSSSLFFSENNLATLLINNYHFEKIAIKKKWPRTIEIKLEEKAFACAWQEDGKTYYADDSGYLLEEILAENIDRTQYPLIVNNSGNKTKAKVTQIDLNSLHFIFNIFEIAKDSPLGFEIDYFLIDDESETVKLVPKAGPIIKFTTRAAVEEQMERLIIIRHEKLEDDFINKQYIDLRYGDKIYFQ